MFYISRGRELFHQLLIGTPMLIALILSVILKKGVLRRRKFVMHVAVSIEEVIKGMRRMMNMKMKISMQSGVVTNLKQRWRRVLVMIQ
jgi:hypothetical protein